MPRPESPLTREIEVAEEVASRRVGGVLGA